MLFTLLIAAVIAAMIIVWRGDYENLLHRLRSRLSEAYRIRHGYGLNPIRNEREMRALIEFCREELKNIEIMKLNPKRREVYEKTIQLYDCGCCPDSVEMDGETYISPYDLIRDYAGWYWN